jgi:hypothetical protein
MVSSLHARTLGIYDLQGDMLDERFTILSEVLHDGGYTTIGVTANPNINTNFGFNQGFDYYEDARNVPAAQRHTAKDIFRAAMDPTPKPPYYMQLNIMEVHGGSAPVRPCVKYPST